MARLTLDENGAKRRFKLNPGQLTIGSGEGATLRLASANVAELHAELLFDAGVARLRPRPGVLPPTLGGKPIQAETVLAHGQTIQFGTARITIEYEEGEGPKTTRTAPAAAAAGAVPAKAGAARATTGRGPVRSKDQPSRKREAQASERSAGPARSRTRAKSGAPTWLVVGLLVLGGALLLYFGRSFFATITTADFTPAGAEYRFNDFLKDSDTIGAQKVLDEFEGQDLTPEWQARVTAMKARMSDLRSMADSGAVEREATRFYEKRLQGYATAFLQNNATREKARVFVRRAKWFLATYPSAPATQLTWVGQMLTRYEGLANLTDPSTFSDVQWEIKNLVEGSPRRYSEALEVIDGLLAYATSEERDAALQLKATLQNEEKEFFKTELRDAAVLYNQKEYPKEYNPAKSMEILIQIVLGTSDPEIADDAARRFAKMPESTVLAGYKRDRTTDFTALVKNSILRARAKELGLVD